MSALSSRARVVCVSCWVNANDIELDCVATQDSVLKAVSNIKTGLWTNLSGGLFSALRLLEKLPYAPPPSRRLNAVRARACVRACVRAWGQTADD